MCFFLKNTYVNHTLIITNKRSNTQFEFKYLENRNENVNDDI